MRIKDIEALIEAPKDAPSVDVLFDMKMFPNTLQVKIAQGSVRKIQMWGTRADIFGNKTDIPALGSLFPSEPETWPDWVLNAVTEIQNMVAMQNGKSDA